MPGSGHRLEVADGLKPASIYLDEASVTGTETALLAAAAAPGRSEIRHAACEPHVVELCEFLRAMGVGVSGEGSHTIRVEGVAKPQGAKRRSMATTSRPAVGRWLVRSPAGTSTSAGTRPVDMEVVASVLTKMGVNASRTTTCFASRRKSSSARDASRPDCGQGFPSDLVSLVTVLATQADGATLVHDWMYELRLFALEQMSGMGADCFSAIRIASSSPARDACAAKHSTAGIFDPEWR